MYHFAAKKRTAYIEYQYINGLFISGPGGTADVTQETYNRPWMHAICYGLLTQQRGLDLTDQEAIYICPSALVDLAHQVGIDHLSDA